MLAPLQQRVGGVWQEQSTQEEEQGGHKGKSQGQAPSPSHSPGYIDDQVDDLGHQDEEGED